MSENQVSGLVLLDKPPGWTSHDAVAHARRALGKLKTGHAGTLDPPATGLLILGVGRATRLLGFLQALPKSYLALIQFGSSTSTQDATGEVLAERPCDFTQETLRSGLERFLGEQKQIPPMVSAVKVGGEPLYKAARRGEHVERPARTVHFYELDLEEFDWARWKARVRVRCSAGTYVRTLAHDLGERLGCGAHLASLRRVAIGSFSVDDAIPPDQVSVSAVLPIEQAVRDFPRLDLGDEESELVRHGRPLPPRPAAREGELPVEVASNASDRPAHEPGMSAGIPVGVFDASGRLLAVYRKHRMGYRPAAVLVG